MTRPPTHPDGLNVEAAEVNPKSACPLEISNFPPGRHEYSPKRHDLFEGVNKCIIFSQEASAKLNEHRETHGSHDDFYTDGSSINERVEAIVVTNRHFQNGETTSPYLSKRLPGNSTIFDADATAITLALNYYWHVGPFLQDVVVYSSSTSCLETIEGENTENPYLPYHKHLLVIEEQRHTCSFLLDTKPFWH